MTYFLMFHLRQLRRALEDLYAYLDAKALEVRKGLRLLKGAEGLNARQRALLQHALKNPDAAYTIKSHQNSHRVAYGTARSDLLQLSARGLLKQNKSGRQFVFSPVPDLSQLLKGPP